MKLLMGYDRSLNLMGDCCCDMIHVQIQREIDAGISSGGKNLEEDC